eukprot:CAMPEP_0198211630 /NCGR_PEP_ID=MMETSP1445-20131203/24891_1 /TAXON_ID=36898 /ORGANISM="Pyramimonas sp., Strain CCMP2087" /LENGTH=67 /DNA_ID=CAMNT_0043885929 /DNA_START=89 /DNA_END=292 /DNA_ORIENTATION=+
MYSSTTEGEAENGSLPAEVTSRALLTSPGSASSDMDEESDEEDEVLQRAKGDEAKVGGCFGGCKLFG